MRFNFKRLTPLSGISLAAAVFCGAAFAQTGLTTIQDTLFKADGTRFTGTLTIQWNTFDAASVGTVIQQSKSVPVVNGNLLVQLAPNAAAPAPANVYMVHYQSDGSQQFTETWTVPVSPQALTVSGVRTGTLSGSGSGGVGNQTPIVESAVVGLTADLAARPVKGPGFGINSVALINNNGQIETVIGNVGDCVFADGTTGACGGQVSSFFDAETPGGIVDGVNTTFTLGNPPSGSSLMLFRNGMYMKAGFDYTLAGSNVSFAAGAGPQPGDTLVASYRIDPSAGAISSSASSATAAPVHGSVAAEVLCSANGRSNNASAFASLGACDIPQASLKAGDRIAVRLNFAHTGSNSGFDFKINWGGTTILSRHGGAADSGVAVQAEAAVTASGTQITVQSWGTVLTFLPGIVNAPSQPGVKVDIQAAMAVAGADSVDLSSYTVLRYPGT